ncbi:hypothetical protein GCM10007897_24140 [Sphingobium jiangsuense]|uniref:Uncharacterized protein n=1 Tax=Sphingobium jiangsuense TaxID=870476 RepID=A0A7W6BPA5_9SPHN|nr:hypothetical protein [Sphingobium jiangsuense]MBB3928611.1 hypothetical protein [Sphingobium jiangsuense]GLT01023.1 hypothetical protein GCM10007897_24140 [Sphingobium jiangsuense]
MNPENHGGSTPANGTTRLYSQTPIADNGDFHYQGDLQQQDESLASLSNRIARHLHDHFDTMRFLVSAEQLVGGRRITAELLEPPSDLTHWRDQRKLITSIRDQMERFGFHRLNLLDGNHDCSFFSEVRIGNHLSVQTNRGRARRDRLPPAGQFPVMPSEQAGSLGFATYNRVPTLPVEIPDGGFTIAARTSEGRRVTFCFGPYYTGGPPRFIDIQYHDASMTVPDGGGTPAPVFEMLTIAQGGRKPYDSRKAALSDKPSIAVILLARPDEAD